MDDHDISVMMVPLLKDNYAYLLAWENRAIVIDPGEAKPVLEALKASRTELQYILSTHHHHDHVGGNLTLKEATGCSVVGPEDRRIPGLDTIVSDDGQLIVGPLIIKALAVPGHTQTHMAYYVRGMLFTGDCLFNGGAGRLFEGTSQQMIDSLRKLSSLPDDTMVYGGHEYTLKNLDFASTLEPHHEPIKERLRRVHTARQSDNPSIPSTLLEEKETNPFLRVHSSALRQSLNMASASDGEVFKKVRALRDLF